MTVGTMHAVFNWEFVSVMIGMSVTVVAVANTLGSISEAGGLPFRINRLWAAFLAALILTVYAAVQGGWSWRPGRVAEVLAFAFILFCISAGANQTVRALARRVGAGRGAEGAPEAERPARGWWASWFR